MRHLLGESGSSGSRIHRPPHEIPPPVGTPLNYPGRRVLDSIATKGMPTVRNPLSNPPPPSTHKQETGKIEYRFERESLAVRTGCHAGALSIVSVIPRSK